MRKQKSRTPHTLARNWWPSYLGGIFLLISAMGTVAASAQIESATIGLVVGLFLLAVVIGGGVAIFGMDVMPAALLALVGFMFFGVALRTVLPRPASTFEFAAHRLLPEYAGSHTVQGGRNFKAVTHEVIPLVPRDWQRGAALDTWVFDPPSNYLGPGTVRGLRLSLSQRETALAAWESALATHALHRPSVEPKFVELLRDPESEDERRVSVMFAVVLAVVGLWVIGKPVAWAWSQISAWRSRD